MPPPKGLTMLPIWAMTSSPESEASSRVWVAAYPFGAPFHCAVGERLCRRCRGGRRLLNCCRWCRIYLLAIGLLVSDVELQSVSPVWKHRQEFWWQTLEFRFFSSYLEKKSSFLITIQVIMHGKIVRNRSEGRRRMSWLRNLTIR